MINLIMLTVELLLIAAAVWLITNGELGWGLVTIAAIITAALQWRGYVGDDIAWSHDQALADAVDAYQAGPGTCTLAYCRATRPEDCRCTLAECALRSTPEDRARVLGPLGGCDYCGHAVGNRHHPACPRGQTESGVRPEGWGAMLRHGAGACTCGQRDITTYGKPDLGDDVRRALFGDHGSDDPDCPVHGRRTRRCVCVETTTGAEYDQGRRTWLPGCERHPAPTSPDQES